MRLKFRAWDTREKRMRKVKQLTLSDRGDKIIDVTPFVQPHIKIIQSTGLADVDGKEIFEGDILLSVASDNPKDHKKWTVLYEDGGFVCEFKHTPRDKRKRHLHEVEHLCEDNIGFYQFKITGNIYENPELLKSSKEI